ncbi:MAG: hypothetical protein K5985_04600 [Lachnospiraceae bacterium]|nr:hypothetical protein [Lachnospiraceae bacterium]
MGLLDDLVRNTRDLAVTLSGHGGTSFYTFDDSGIDCNDPEYALKMGQEISDPEQSGNWLLRAARLGSAEAGAHLAASYLDVGNYTEAYNWASWAADNGSLTGKGVLGACFILGRGCKRDPDRGFALTGQAVRQGDAATIGLMAVLYENEEFGMKDYWLSTMYYEMLFLNTPLKDFADHMRKMYFTTPREFFTDYETSGLNNPRTDYLSDGYDELYINKNFDRAVKLYYCGYYYEDEEYSADCAAKCSIAAAMANRSFLSILMGEHYCNDFYDHTEADPISFYALALKNGYGDIEKNPQEAFRLFNKSLDLKRAPIALCNLGEMLFRGEGCTMDREKGVALIKEAMAAEDDEDGNAHRIMELLRKEYPEAFLPPVLPATNHASAAPSPSMLSANAASSRAGDPASSQAPKSPFLAINLYGVEKAEDYWSGTVPSNIINRDKTPVAMFNLILKRPILSAGNYTLKYVFSDRQGLPLSEGTTAIAMGVGSDRLAQAFFIKDDPAGEYHVTFSLEELGMSGLSYTYRIVSDVSTSPEPGRIYRPDASVTPVGNIGGVALHGTNDGNDYWGGTDVGHCVDERSYAYAMFQIFTAAAYTGDRVIELRLVIRDELGSVIRDDCTELEVHAGYDRFAKSLPLVPGDGKYFAPGHYTAEISIDLNAPFIFPFDVK